MFSRRFAGFFSDRRSSFNQGEGQEENAIVTSSGQYVIAWDFAKVKKGKLDQYEIKKYEDHVVQDNFKFGDDKEIVRLFLLWISNLIDSDIHIL